MYNQQLTKAIAVGICKQIIIFTFYETGSMLVTIFKFIYASIQTSDIFILTVCFSMTSLSSHHPFHKYGLKLHQQMIMLCHLDVVACTPP
jgi:hypothetical protein